MNDDNAKVETNEQNKNSSKPVIGSSLLIWASILVGLGLLLLVLVQSRALNQFLISVNPDIASTLWVLFFTCWPLFSLIGAVLAIRCATTSKMWKTLPALSKQQRILAWTLASVGVISATLGLLALIPNVLNMALNGLPL